MKRIGLVVSLLVCLLGAVAVAVPYERQGVEQGDRETAGVLGEQGADGSLWWSMGLCLMALGMVSEKRPKKARVKAGKSDANRAGRC